MRCPIQMGLNVLDIHVDVWEHMWTQTHAKHFKCVDITIESVWEMKMITQYYVVRWTPRQSFRTIFAYSSCFSRASRLTHMHTESPLGHCVCPIAPQPSGFDRAEDQHQAVCGLFVHSWQVTQSVWGAPAPRTTTIYSRFLVWHQDARVSRYV